MKYYVADFDISCAGEDMSAARDVLAALLGEAGFEAFEETSAGLRGYVQRCKFDGSATDAVVASFPMGGVSISYVISEAEDRDWNATWEAAGFPAVTVGQTLIIVPPGTSASDVDTTGKTTIVIDARQAFGTGTHETTQMIAEWLTETDVRGLRVLDCGCGTGILSIVASKMGAASIECYDIDEWSVSNTSHNAALNGCNNIKVWHGDARLLDSIAPGFDIILANLNRNILLNDMAAMRRVAAPGARLVMSGFYAADSDLLSEHGATLGLTLTESRTAGNDGWCMTVMTVGD